VLLDDKVELDVPLDDLAVHEPDARKADRVPEGDGVLHPQPPRRRLFARSIRPTWTPISGHKSAPSAASAATKAAGGATGDLFASPPATVNPGADKQDKAASPKGTPISLAAARAEAARKLPVDRSKYQTIRSLDQLKAWIARAHDVGHFAIDAQANIG